MKPIYAFFALVLSVFTFASTPILIQTSITDVFVDGTAQRTGSITMRIEGDFLPGETISQSQPLYVRLTWDKNAVLGQTLVDPEHGRPVDLYLEARGDSPIADNLPESAVQLVRAVAGERELWLRFSEPASSWMDTDDDGNGDSAPTEINPVDLTINSEGVLTNNHYSESGFDFSGSAHVDTYAHFGCDTRIADTVLAMNYEAEGCGTLGLTGIDSLQFFDVLAFSTGVEPGDPGSPEAASAGNLDPATCEIDGGVDAGAYSLQPVDFSNDFVFARGVDENRLGTSILVTGETVSRRPVTLTNRVFGDLSPNTVTWTINGRTLWRQGSTIRYRFFRPGDYTVTATTTNVNGLTATAEQVITISPRH
ncbi:MAG: PKD domain-containing protein [Acidobacteriota bacterium]|nr:PKD domain-containing protein [Acidobacteriota bacterium]